MYGPDNLALMIHSHEDHRKPGQHLIYATTRKFFSLLRQWP